jgi:HK97 family phage major capsid protein
MVSDDCARHFGANFIHQCAKSGKLDLVSQSTAVRDALLSSSRDILGLQSRTALTTTDIPLPTEYAGEFRALIAQFGVVRKAMFPYPIGMGTAKPPRMGARPQFASIAMSAPVTEGSPTLTFASLESHKVGGLVRVPREIEEQSIVPLGQFLARYGAVEFARIEDTWGFLADGGNTYEQVKGVAQICADNNKVNQLPPTKNSPSDAAIGDFRAMRLLVATPVLNSGKYYMNATWEQRLRQFETQADPMIYEQNGPNGRPTLDGYDVIWTEVLPAFTTGPAASTVIAIFGDLSFWWMGEHLSPRMDTSDQVFFVNDQLAVRFLEEIDFDYMDVAAAAALKTAA